MAGGDVAGDPPLLLNAGSSSLTLRWLLPPGADLSSSQSLEAEIRHTGWLLGGAWKRHVLVPEDISFPPSSFASSSSSTCPSPHRSPYHSPRISPSDSPSDPRLFGVLDDPSPEGSNTGPPVPVSLTLRGLDAETSFDVKLSIQLQIGGSSASSSKLTSPAASFRTFALAPALQQPPSVRCARHDRLLLHWAGPSTQAEEVLAYRVRYFDCEPRWPVKHEVEAKLACRLLRPSEQTSRFLEGSAAMRIVVDRNSLDISSDGSKNNSTAGNEDAKEPPPEDVGRTAIHFWLTNLAPSRMYYVQVAAITAGGQGQWSSKSSPLYTWRKAPALKAPQLLFCTQSTAILGLSLEQLQEGCRGQDEEVDRFEITFQLDEKGAQLCRTEVLADVASELAGRLRPLLEEELILAGDYFPSHVVVLSGLSPLSAYNCASLAITHAGRGAPSPQVRAETLAVPSNVTELCVHRADHCSASISWKAAQRFQFSELVTCSLGPASAAAELADRHLRGFRLRLATLPTAKGNDNARLANHSRLVWREVLGVRASSTAALREHGSFSIELRDLPSSSVCLLQIVVVSQGSGEGVWSDSAEIRTEALAPELTAAPELDIASRQGAIFHWISPDVILGAPVLGYRLYLCQAKERGRSAPAAAQEFELLLQGPDGSSSSSSASASIVSNDVARVWYEDGVTRAELTDLKPGTSYTMQVAAFTARGVGKRSKECSITTRPCAPAMGPRGPGVLDAYYDRLVLECAGPMPDWPDSERSDVLGFSARYYECARYGPHGAWVQIDQAELELSPVDGNCIVDVVRFQLPGLLPERQYVVQVAAVTAAGRGPWSDQSERLCTWRVAPNLQAPRPLFRTHTSVVLGWDLEQLGRDDRDDRDRTTSTDGVAVHDEEIQEFVVRVSPVVGASRAQMLTLRVPVRQSDHLAQVWEEASPTLLADGTLGEQIKCGISRSSSSSSATPMGRWSSRAMLFEAPGSTPPKFVAVFSGLSPDKRYTCTVSAVSSAGEGDFSTQSAEVATLTVAHPVESAQVDEVQHNQIQISWEHLQPKSAIPTAYCERLGIQSSVDELELRGYSVRCALWSTWTRLAWREPAYAEVETLSLSEGGRVHFAICDLEPERQYAIEVRAHSCSGAGEWCRIGDQPICTAIVAQPPAAPELVYATPRALTFSFAGVEDEQIVAYEVRRHEGWAGGWGRPSKPLRFDRQWLGVRVTSENRWVVTMDQLQWETAYSLQLRGLTANGGITKWSARSEAMCTLQAPGEAEVELDPGVGINDGVHAGRGGQDSGSSHHGGQRQVTSPESEKPESVDDFSKKLEAILSFTIDYATAGVRLPSVRIPSIAEEAEELLKQHRGSQSAAVLAAARIEDDASWRTKLPDFLIQQVPVVGCSTVLLRELWRNIRRCALIAHIYGHDTRSAETQALILTCLVPAGSAGPAPPVTGASGVPGGGAASTSTALPIGNGSGLTGASSGTAVEDIVNSRRVALMVSRALAKETFVRATGLKSAGQVVGMLEVAGRLLTSYSTDSQPPTRSKTEREGSKDSGVGGGSTERITDDAFTEEQGPVNVALVVFRPMSMEERPLVIFGLLALWLLPIFVTAARFVAAKIYPLLAQRIQMELPIAAAVGLLIVTQVVGIMGAVWVQQNMENFVSVPATLVFVIYAIIPGTSIYLATRSVLQGANEAPFFALLGVYNGASGYLRWASDLSDDAALEHQPAPRVASCREQVTRLRRALWVLLVVDFVVEELLGRVCRLHSARLLGAPADDSNATLVEYRTVSFAMGLLAAWAQARVLDLLQRRTTLLRLLGARKAFLGGITMLLMGAFAVVQQPRTVSFLREVSPTPWWCCMVLWIRQFGAIVGALVPLVLYGLAQPRSFGRLPVDTLVALALIVGAALGHSFCQTFNGLWLEKKEHLESDYRVLHLFPHMSSQARKKASVAMRLALKRGAEATRNTAAEWMAARAVRTGLNFVGSILARRALPAG
ncbi:unnamed protein product [Polarella glacialis]|uniref:Fibronectin type-III domain-containing protein n=1 Tax=Polarella glacialis TaxID=89957 RepID=A0A813K956_POLGL|nr:unnamed protein product [Polarella glacialis]